MFPQVISISGLLLGAAFLFLASGIAGLLLPIRGIQEGFSELSLGLLGAGWAVGYVAGCLTTPYFVARIGHIRAFSVLSALAAVTLLASVLFVSPMSWIPLRIVTGICFAGATMIIESWLGERAEAKSRGQIFGIYITVVLLATTTGQVILPLGDSTGFLFFILAAMLCCFALMPIAVSSTQSPNPLTKVRLDLPQLWTDAPVGVLSVFMVGIANASFGTMVAVYGHDVGMDLAETALFASAPILAGAVTQIPVGYLSDRFDRRNILLAAAAAALVTEFIFIAFQPDVFVSNMMLAAAFGAALYAIYPLAIAHANDRAAGLNYLQVSAGLLLVFGIGSILGPLVSSVAMHSVGASGLFMTSFIAHGSIAAFTLWRIVRRPPLDIADRGEFIYLPLPMAATPETIAIREDEKDEALSGIADAA